MLLLCVTGLPLIFNHEINDWMLPQRPALQEAGHAPKVETIIKRAALARPGERVNYAYFDDTEPMVLVATAPRADSSPDDTHYQLFDLRDGFFYDGPQPNEGLMYIITKLHVDLFAGMKGMLFLGAMAALLVIAIISGVILYAPFMRNLSFGTIRAARSRRIYWLDMHNLLGIATAFWLGVVGLTGAINTLAMPIEMVWQATELSQMAKAPPDAPNAPQVPVDDVLAAISAAAPEKRVRTLAFPGTPFASPHHFGAYLIGNTAVTSRLLTPALVDSGTGRLVSMREMPLYAKALFISQPLHFGDYGGLPLKIMWAVLDLLTIVVLGSGLYLWFARRKTVAARVAQLAGADGRIESSGATP